MNLSHARIRLHYFLIPRFSFGVVFGRSSDRATLRLCARPTKKRSPRLSCRGPRLLNLLPLLSLECRDHFDFSESIADGITGSGDDRNIMFGSVQIGTTTGI